MWERVKQIALGYAEMDSILNCYFDEHASSCVCKN